MYNKILKSNFIDDREQNTNIPKTAFLNMFAKSEPMEKELHKDVSLFSINEILELYKTVNTRSVDVLINLNSQFAMYATWCMSRNLIPTGINNFREITIEMLATCVNVLAMESGILSEEEIYSIIRRMQNDREKFFLLMLYETGKTKNFEHIFKAKISDFDFDNLKLHTSDGRVVDVSSYLCEIAASTDKELDYNSYLESADERVVTRKRKLIDRGYIYKETDTAKSDNIQLKISRTRLGIKKGLAIIGVPAWVNLKDFQNSGIINHVKRLATENEISTQDVVWDVNLRSQIENQHAVKILSPKAFIRKYGDFL